MKKFTKIVGLLLCFAIVLSFVPAPIANAVTGGNDRAVELTPVTGLTTPQFGYYTNGTSGTITPYYQSGREPQYLIDGSSNTQTRSEQLAYDDVTSGAKTPVVLFTLPEATTLAGVKIEGYQYKRYNMENFEVQVSTTSGTDTWVTAATVTDAFRDGNFGDDVAPLMVEFDQSYTAYKLRIVVKKITNMVEGLDPNDGDYAELAAGGYIRIKEITLYEGQIGGSTEPAPDAGEMEELTLAAPVVGYYTNDTTGNITNHHHATHAPANMVDGDTTNQSRSGYYTHAEIASKAKIPVILFNFDTNVTFGSIEVYGYQTSRYNMEDFEVQVNTAEGWKTAATVTDAFYVEGSFGDDLTGPLKVNFDQTYTGAQLRILVSGISDMTPDGAEDAEMLEGGYIRIREIKLYGVEAAGDDSGNTGGDVTTYPETAKLNGVDIENYVIVYSDAELDYNLRAAEYIQSEILKKTGRTVEIVEDDTAESAYEIIVGQTNRSLSASLTAPGDMQMKFAIQANGTKIAMEADYFIIAGAAYYFVDTFISNADFENTVPSEKQELAPITKKAKNYIFLIGDGMGYMQTRFFEKFGASPTTGTYGFGDGEDVFYGYYFPYQGESKTCNVFGTITDSAAGGTALATGYKTVNGYVGRDMLENDITNLSELAWGMGKAVGIMSTEGSDGATPASFSAHTSGRYDNEVITDQDALEAQGYLFVERYRGSQDAANAVFKTFTAEEFGRWDAKVQNGLEKLAKDPDGFFMMYEEAYIDKNCHNDDQQNAWRTVYRFNQHIANFMEFAMYNPDTFVLITADHETSGLTEEFVATQFNLPPETGCDHSLQNVPVFAYGVGGELFDDVVAHNTSIGRTFAHLMTNGNADDFGDPQYPILTTGYKAPENTQDPDAPDAPTTPVKQGTILKVVSPTKITAKFGVYTGGTPNGTFDDGGDGECLTDGWYYRSAYSERNKSAGLTAALLDLKTAVNLGGIEFTGHKEAGNDPTNFEVQVMVDGQWQTVYTVTSHPFAEGPRTVKYTFEPVMTNQVRVLIHDYQGTEDCYIGEITLFESTTGNLSQKVEVADKQNVLTDGDKSTCFTGDNAQIVLAANGQPTAVSGFNLYLARARGTAVPTSVTITIQTSLSGTFVPIGVFPTGWNDDSPQDSVFVEFDKTYVAYAMHVVFDKRSSATELELFQHIHEEAPDEPSVTPTEPTVTPTEPTVAPTEPTVAPTEPTVAPTEPTVAPTEPTVTPTEPTVAPTEPTVTPTEPTVTPTEPTVTPTEPEGEEPTVTPTEPTDEPADEPADEPTEAPTDAPTEAPTEPADKPTEDPDAVPDTGDIVLSILAGMMALSAVGGAAVIGKKKR